MSREVQSRRRWMIPLTLSIVAFLLALGVIIAGLGNVTASLRSFTWRLLPVIFVFTLANYAVRFWRWDRLLRRVSNEPSMSDSALVFFAGNVMLLTPARMGEFIKSYYLSIMYGLAPASTSPIVVVERVSDGIAMLALASLGILLLGSGWQIALPIGVALAGFYWALTKPAVLRWIAGGLAKYDSTRRFARPVSRFQVGAEDITSNRGFAQSLVLGTVAWAIECVTFFVVLVGVGASPSPQLLLQASMIFPLGTLVGTFSLLPAGLGAAEATIATLTVLVVGLTSGEALVASVIVRATILGVGLVLGMVASIVIARKGISTPGEAES
jgi:uncharacterized protein (TIRG00374 family)